MRLNVTSRSSVMRLNVTSRSSVMLLNVTSRSSVMRASMYNKNYLEGYALGVPAAPQSLPSLPAHASGFEVASQAPAASSGRPST